jgi:hypothetical protein
MVLLQRSEAIPDTRPFVSVIVHPLEERRAEVNPRQPSRAFAAFQIGAPEQANGAKKQDAAASPIHMTNWSPTRPAFELSAALERHNFAACNGGGAGVRLAKRSFRK